MLDADYEFRLNNFATTACYAVVNACPFLVLHGELLINPSHPSSYGRTMRLAGRWLFLFFPLLGLSFDFDLFGRSLVCCLAVAFVGRRAEKRKLGQSSSP